MVRIAEAEVSAEQQRKLAVRSGHSQGRYDPGILYAGLSDSRRGVYSVYSAPIVDVCSYFFPE